jgi:hypothetical protein
VAAVQLGAADLLCSSFLQSLPRPDCYTIDCISLHSNAMPVGSAIVLLGGVAAGSVALGPSPQNCLTLKTQPAV